MFNPEEFMNTNFDGGEAFETRRTLVPASEYTSMIDKIEAKLVGENDDKPIFSVTHKLVNTGDDALDGRMLWDTIWLDLDSAGNLERGADKNLRLGQYLESVGLNGKPWSPGMLQGQVVMIKVTQSLNKRTGEEENRITSVTKAA